MGPLHDLLASITLMAKWSITESAIHRNVMFDHFLRHMSYILGMIYNYTRTMDLGTTCKLTTIRKLDNKSHGNNKMYRQAIDRA